MTDQRDQDAVTDEAGAIPVAHVQTVKARKTLSSLKRELSDEELGSSGVQKMLLGELDKLEEEKGELSGFREKYHQVNLQLAIANAKVKTTVAADTIFGAMITLGALIAGYAPSVWDKQPTGWLCLAVGPAAIAIGIAAKVLMK
ncbi:hypothetical protein [Burkholderia sp. GS2Y]|uniref:DUF2335 domain-containing protein n=1 Tax=Burkholderia theae TaxID=3143496 RepID=A0ABU9WNC6_9BURK